METEHEFFINKETGDRVVWLFTESDENQNTLAVFRKLTDMSVELKMEINEFFEKYVSEKEEQEESK